MRHPRGGFSHVSKFLGFSDAARMGNAKAEVWGDFLEEKELRREGGLCPRGRGDVCDAGSLAWGSSSRNIALLEMAKYFVSRFC